MFLCYGNNGVLSHINKSMSSECLYSQGLDQRGRGIISQYLFPEEHVRLTVRLQLPASCFCFSFVLCSSSPVNLVGVWTRSHGVNRFCFALCCSIKAGRHRGTKKNIALNGVFLRPVSSSVDTQICFPVSDKHCGEVSHPVLDCTGWCRGWSHQVRAVCGSSQKGQHLCSFLAQSADNGLICCTNKHMLVFICISGVRRGQSDFDMDVEFYNNYLGNILCAYFIAWANGLQVFVGIFPCPCLNPYSTHTWSELESISRAVPSST